MKKIFFCFLFLFLFTSIYSQTYTEKYNSLNNRYEFFNSSGSMIGYKIYNSLNQRWETYMTNTSNTNTTIESNVNIPLAMKALSITQGRYDTNLARVNGLIESLKTRLYNSSLDATTVQNIRTRFNTEYTSQIGKYDLSSNATTQKVINWLESGFDFLVNTETPKLTEPTDEEKKGVFAFRGNYGGFTIPLIEEYTFKNGKWILLKFEKNNGYIYYDGNRLHLKRGTGNWVFRNLDYKSFDTALKAYTYTSPYGETTIDETFSKITFYNSTIDEDRKYIYTIGKMDKNIKPQ